MINRRTLFKTAAGGAAAAAGGAALTGCNRRNSDQNHVTLWGVGGSDAKDQQTKVIKKFTEKHPHITIDAKEVPSNGKQGDATPVITAVRAGTGPDLWYMDGFTAAQYAALGLIEPIDDLIAKYESPKFLDKWVGFTVTQLEYKGKTYGLPLGTDARGLIYNKKLLHKAGVDPDELDMSNKPVTVHRLLEMAEKVTKKDKSGDYTQMGFVPWHGQGSAYTWSMGTKANYFDADKCELNVTSKPVHKAYKLLYDFARKKGYKRIDAFISGYEPTNAPPGQTAFNGGKLAMSIEESGTIHTVKKYAPKLDWGYTHLPVFHDGDDPYTWSGGFALVMPKGSSKSKAAWDFMKYYAGVPGHSIFSPGTFALPTRPEVFDHPKLKDLQPAIKQLKYSTSRPPIPVGELWWDGLNTAQDSVTLGTHAPTEALQIQQDRLEPQMETYCPFKLPKSYGKTGI